MSLGFHLFAADANADCLLLKLKFRGDLKMGEVECPIRLYVVLTVSQPKPGGMGCVSHQNAYTGDY